jgi:hypothetical protein
VAADNFFEVAAELAIQGYRCATLFKNFERIGKQAGRRRIAWQQSGDYAGVRFDVNLIAIRCTSHEPIEVACRFGTRDVNDRHATTIPRLLAPL